MGYSTRKCVSSILKQKRKTNCRNNCGMDICNINVVQGSICRQVEKKLKALDEIIGELREQCRATVDTVYPKKYAHGFCFAVLCCGYTLTDFPISIRLTSLALWQSNDCPSASKATLMNMDKYFM